VRTEAYEILSIPDPSFADPPHEAGLTNLLHPDGLVSSGRGTSPVENCNKQLHEYLGDSCGVELAVALISENTYCNIRQVPFSYKE